MRVLFYLSRQYVVCVLPYFSNKAQQGIAFNNYVHQFILFKFSSIVTVLATYMSFDILRWKRISSSNILELYVNLKNFDDCLYLLDDRFNEFCILYVNISAIYSGQTIDNKVN